MGAVRRGHTTVKIELDVSQFVRAVEDLNKAFNRMATPRGRPLLPPPTRPQIKRIWRVTRVKAKNRGW